MLTNVFPYVCLVKNMQEDGESKIGNKVLPPVLRVLPVLVIDIVDEDEDVLSDMGWCRERDVLLTGDRVSREDGGESPKYSRPSLHLDVKI